VEKQARPVARIFAILFAILFVITAVAAILLFNLMKLAFNPNVYKQALSTAGVYERLPELIGEQIVFSMSRNPCVQNPASCTDEQLNATPAYLSGVDASEWAMILSGLVDSDWLKLQVESGIDQTMIFLSTPGQPFQLDISLVELKTRIGGEAGYQSILNLLNSLEPCTTGDVLSLLGATLNPDSQVNLPLCRPSETVLKLGESAIRDSLSVVADMLPDNTSTLLQSKMPGIDRNLIIAQSTLQLIRTLAKLTWVIPMILLLVITLLVVRSLKDFLSWWGVPLLATGALTLLTSLSITFIIRAIAMEKVNAFVLSPGLIEMIKNAVFLVVDYFRNSLFFQAMILVIIGIVMIILAAIIPPKSNPKPE